MGGVFAGSTRRQRGGVPAKTASPNLSVERIFCRTAKKTRLMSRRSKNIEIDVREPFGLNKIRKKRFFYSTFF
jgi:hypothetical protein